MNAIGATWALACFLAHLPASLSLHMVGSKLPISFSGVLPTAPSTLATDGAVVLKHAEESLRHPALAPWAPAN
jgi:hypothetical protein